MLPYGLWLLAALLFAEVGRFLHGEVQRRRALDDGKFPSDPRRAARLSAAMLEASDVAESGRGWGFIVRVDAALAALLAALGNSMLGGALGGAPLGLGLLFWVGLALGPAQLAFLLPAVGIGLNAGQSQAVRSILRGSVPAFIVSGACFVLLVAAGPRPAPPAAAPAPPSPQPAPPRPLFPSGNAWFQRAPGYAPAAAAVGASEEAFSLSLPENWRAVSRQVEEGRGAVRFAPSAAGASEPAAYVQVEYRPGAVLAARGASAEAVEDAVPVSGAGPAVVSPVVRASLGGLPARRQQFLRVDVEGLRVLRERWSAESGGTSFALECFGREPDIALAEAACDLAAATFRALGSGLAAPAEMPR